jgi:hypothetical protein
MMQWWVRQQQRWQQRMHAGVQTRAHKSRSGLSPGCRWCVATLPGGGVGGVCHHAGRWHSAASWGAVCVWSPALGAGSVQLRPRAVRLLSAEQ